MLSLSDNNQVDIVDSEAFNSTSRYQDDYFEQISHGTL